jgi:hypothetical protein
MLLKKSVLIVILLILLILFLSVASAFSVTYNFNSTYENINMWAYECIRLTGDNSLLLPSQLSSCHQLNDVTSNTAFDADDTTYFPTSTTGSTWKSIYFIVRPSMNFADVTFMNITFVGRNGLTSNVKHNLTFFNVTANGFTISENKTVGATSSVSFNKTFSYGLSDIINSNKNITFAYYRIGGTYDSENAPIDFAQLSLTYDSLVINSPISNQQIFNSLSTTLNTSQSAYNRTVWYTWNNGIKNTTLCTNSNECQGTITFPRQGAYNLSVYSNKSDSSINSQTINLFVGNNSITNDTEDIVASDADSSYKETESQIKFDMTNYLNKNIHSSNLFLNISFVNFPIVTSGYYAYFVNNQSWNESVSPSGYDSMPKSAITQGLFSPDRGTSNTTKNVWVSIDVTNITQQFNNLQNLTIRFSSNDTSSSAHNTHYNTPTSLIKDYVSDSNSNLYTLDTGEYQGVFVGYAYNYFAKENNVSIPYLNISYYSQNIVPVITNILANNSNFLIKNVTFTFNITDDNDYLKNISLFIDGIINSTIFYSTINVSTNNQFNFSVSNISEGLHTWFIQSYDSDGSQSNSSVFTFRIDQTPPSLTWTYPIDDGLISSVKTNTFNYTVSDSGVGLSTCWWSNSSGKSNHTITCGTNITDKESTDGLYNITLWANDTLNNVNSIVRYFRISVNNPIVTLNYPPNNQWFNHTNNLIFNFSVIHTNPIKNCSLWGNWTGTWSKNQTNSSSVSNTGANYNFSALNISDGFYSWNTQCFESVLSREGWYGINRTFGVDTIFPQITNILLSTTPGDRVFSFTYTLTELNKDSCKYSLDDGLTNVTIPLCFSSVSTSVISLSTDYNLTIYSTDLAGNSNSSTQIVNIPALAPLSVSPGGGGGGTEEKIGVIGIENNNYSKTYTNLEREAVYSSINNFCSNKLRQGSLAVSDYSSSCSLTTSDLATIKTELSEMGIVIESIDMSEFYQMYKNSNLFQGSETKATIDKYGLFTSVLGLTKLLQLNPSSVDSPKIIFVDGGFYQISVKISSNKPLKNCEVTSTNKEFSCELTSNSTVLVTLSMNNTQFFSKIFQGAISVTTDTDDPTKIETRQVSVSLRVYNLRYFNLFWAFGVIASIIGLIFIYRHYRKKKKKLNLSTYLKLQ